MEKGYLILEDGFVLEGRIFGESKSSIGEVVFNTAMSGYQEILTDPSYCGQIVTMTYPLIGNYGVNKEDVESENVWVSGFVVRELSRIYSNWRAEGSLEEYLKENSVVGITEIDTRALTCHLREYGSIQGAIVPKREFDSVKNWQRRIRESEHIEGRNLAKVVSTENIYDIEGEAENGIRVGVIDCGVKKSILWHLKKRVSVIRVFPWDIEKDELLEFRPDGVLFSNGPGDPSAVDKTIDLAKSIIEKVPVFGICLGHQILSIAIGAKTYKLKFGHHGGNHPVKEISTGRIDITSQNHNFCVDLSDVDGIIQTHINLYDGTLEGIYSEKYRLFSVQFHPEAGPGPFDAEYIFDRFMEVIKGA